MQLSGASPGASSSSALSRHLLGIFKPQKDDPPVGTVLGSTGRQLPGALECWRGLGRAQHGHVGERQLWASRPVSLNFSFLVRKIRITPTVPKGTGRTFRRLWILETPRPAEGPWSAHPSVHDSAIHRDKSASAADRDFHKQKPLSPLHDLVFEGNKGTKTVAGEKPGRRLHGAGRGSDRGRSRSGDGHSSEPKEGVRPAGTTAGRGGSWAERGTALRPVSRKARRGFTPPSRRLLMKDLGP